MDCTEFLENYSDYLDRRLESRPLSEYREHLERCSSCARYDRVMQRGLRVVRELTPPEPGPDFLPRLQHRIFHIRDDITYGRRFSGAGTVAAVIAAGLVVLTSLGLLGDREHVAHLPPVVIEAPTRDAFPGVFGASPPSPNLMVVPESRDFWLTDEAGPISVFRAPLGAHRSRTVAVTANTED